MKAKRRFNIWLWVLLCVPCLLASCDHDVHDGEEGSVVILGGLTFVNFPLCIHLC